MVLLISCGYVTQPFLYDTIKGFPLLTNICLLLIKSNLQFGTSISFLHKKLPLNLKISSNSGVLFIQFINLLYNLHVFILNLVILCLILHIDVLHKLYLILSLLNLVCVQFDWRRKSLSWRGLLRLRTISMETLAVKRYLLLQIWKLLRNLF